MADKTASKPAAFFPEGRETIRKTIDGLKDDLTALSLYMHANPELKWEEKKAKAKLTSYLKDRGYEIGDYDKHNLPTAWRVSYTRGKGGRTFGLNSEMDALPGIGHACGHNLIAISGIGAFLALREAMDKHGIDGTIVLLGTPAEEGAAGKVELIKAGAYKDMDACMMIHPMRSDDGKSSEARVIRSLAYQHVNVKYQGKPAHAGLCPWEGVNALDAAVAAYSSVSSLRQQLKPDVRVQGVITNGGGAAPNIIPEHSEMNYLVRASTGTELNSVRDKVVDCFKGAALSSGCKVDTEIGDLMEELRNDNSLADEYAAVMGDMFDIPVEVNPDASMGGSTDFGNVTHTLPGCHPFYGIPADPGALNHTHGFTKATKSPEAHDESYKHMTGMACVGLRFLKDDKFAKDVRASWEKQMKELKEQEAK